MKLPSGRLPEMLVLVGLPLFLNACSTETGTPVRKLDFSRAPQLGFMASPTRKMAEDLYPVVCALLEEGETNRRAPAQFDVLVKKKLAPNRSGETRNDQICLDARWLEQLKDDPDGLKHVLVHEMAHVAQHYYRPILGHWLLYAPNPPSCWQEGIADYVCFKLGITNGWSCAQCSYPYPHYRDGYACAGAFLLYLEETYNSSMVRQLNAVIRKGDYADDFFEKVTGKDLQTLWAEFQHTPGFTPQAARMLELQQELGFKNGKPPRDIERRLKRFMDYRADELTKKMIDRAFIPGLQATHLSTRLAIICYFTQPGGTAEAFLATLSEKKTLPGFGKDEHGTLTGVLKSRDLSETFPATRSFTATKKGESSTYHYTVCRASQESPWKLQRAWRTTSSGELAEEYRAE